MEVKYMIRLNNGGTYNSSLDLYKITEESNNYSVMIKIAIASRNTSSVKDNPLISRAVCFYKSVGSKYGNVLFYRTRLIEAKKYV